MTHNYNFRTRGGKVLMALPFLLVMYFATLLQTNAQSLITASDGGFENGANTLAANGWTVVNGSQVNQWVVNTGAITGFSGSRCAYISNTPAGTPPSHTYTLTSASSVFFYRDVVFPAGQTSLTLTFNFIGAGQTTVDRMRIWMVPTSYTPTAGTAITTAGTAPTGRIAIGLANYNAAASWTSVTAIIPTAYAGTTCRLVFEWVNNAAGGTPPPAGIDNIQLVAAAPAANDACASATPITPGVSCVATAGSSAGATQQFAPTACSGFTASAANEVWYSFTATGTASYNISVTGTNGFDPVLALYSGCATGNFISCIDGTVGNGTESISAGMLAAGTYYYRIYGWAGALGTFNTCVTVVAPPANDVCASATSITPGLSCTPTAGVTANATQQFAPTACDGYTSTTANDVWYTFTADGTSSYSISATTTGGNDVVLGTYSSCGTMVTCADFYVTGTEVISTGVLPAGPYYYRIYGADGTFPPFTTCVTILPSPPANDNCAGAINLTPGLTCVTTAGTTVNASQSMAASTCNFDIGNANDDVWYSFTATNASHNVTAVGNGTFDAILVGYSGACGSLTEIGCADATFNGGTETMALTGLTVGVTYRFRIYSYGGVAENGTFTVCVTQPAPPPANDQCSAVTPVALAAGSPVTFNGNSVGATTTNDGAFNTVPTVWHAITTTTCGDITVSYCTTSPAFQDIWINLATNCPATATTPDGVFTACGSNYTITWTGLAAGTYYIPVLGDEPGFVTPGPYTLDVSMVNCPPPPSNDLVCGASAVTVGTTTTPSYLATTNVNATDGSLGFGSAVCSIGDFANDVWFTAVVPSTGNIVVQIDPTSVLTDLIAEVYTSSNGTCSGTLTAVGCNDDGGLGTRPFTYVGGLTPGNNIYIRVSAYDAADPEGTFGIAVTDAVHWTGTTSGSPTVVTNWLGSPDNASISATTDVRIFNVPNAIAPMANFNVLDVYMNDGATVAMSGGNLRVNGDWHGASSANPANVTGVTNDILILLGNSGVIDGYTNVQRMRINSVGAYSISAGSNHLNVSTFLQATSGTLNTNGNITFLSGPTGTAFLNDFGTNVGIVSGNINMQRYNPIGVTGYRQLGTPVAMPNISGVNGFTVSGIPGFVIPDPSCNPNYVAYNSPYGSWVQLVESATVQYSCNQSLFQVLTAGGMTNGRGYYMDAPGGSTFTFTGAPNTGIVTYPVTHTPANTAVANGWNMVSNPFPSPMLWETIGVNVPAGIDAIAKLWVTSGTYMGTWQDLDPSAGGTQAVAIGQAFQVRVTIPGTTIPFLVDNTDRTTNAPSYLFAGGDPMTLNIDITGNGFADITKVRFIDGATAGLDANYDSPKMIGNANQPMVYSIWNGENYSTNSYGALDQVYALPLGVKIATSGQHSLVFSNVDQFPASALVYLEDVTNGTMQDIRANDTYPFTQTAGDITNRFILHFYPPVEESVVDATCETTGQVTLTEESPSTWAYTLENAQSATVSQGTLDASQTITNLPAGDYTLTLTHQTGYVAVETVTVTGAQQVTATAQVSVANVEAGQEIQFTGNTQNATAWDWNFGDGNTSSEQNPLHVYNATGNYTATLVASNGNCDETAQVSVSAYSTASIDNNIENAGVKMWNDNNIVYMNFEEQWTGKTVFTLYDMTGKKVFQQTISHANGKQSVDCGILAAGTYTAEVKNANKSASRKVVMGTK